MNDDLLEVGRRWLNVEARKFEADDALEAVKIEFDKVVDRDPEVLLDCGDELTGTIREGGIDLEELPGPDVVHDEVTWDGKDRDRVSPLIGTQQQGHVRVDSQRSPRDVSSAFGLLPTQDHST
jgi:hypothetical protein